MLPGRYHTWPTDELQKTLVNLEMYVPYADKELRTIYEEIETLRIRYELILRTRERTFVHIPRIRAELKERTQSGQLKITKLTYEGC